MTTVYITCKTQRMRQIQGKDLFQATCLEHDSEIFSKMFRLLFVLQTGPTGFQQIFQRVRFRES